MILKAEDGWEPDVAREAARRIGAMYFALHDPFTVSASDGGPWMKRAALIVEMTQAVTLRVSLRRPPDSMDCPACGEKVVFGAKGDLARAELYERGIRAHAAACREANE